MGILSGADYRQRTGETFHGLIVEDAWILVAYTWYGDSNLDGIVDAEDYAAMNLAYTLSHDADPDNDLPATWANGDYNYDGAVDDLDYLLAGGDASGVWKVEVVSDDGSAAVVGQTPFYDVTLPTLSEGSREVTATAYDAAGNTFVTPPLSLTVDRTAPDVTIDQALNQLDPTAGSPIRFTVVFGEAVSDFDAADVDLSGTAPGLPVAEVSGSGTTYDVAVSGMTGSGTVVAAIPAGAAHDAAGNANTASTSTDNEVTYDAPPPTGEIRGAKWNDLDGDGTRDAGEPGLPGWTIYIDGNANGHLDPGEPSDETDANGEYALAGLGQGEYLVAEVPQSGWSRHTPSRRPSTQAGPISRRIPPRPAT